MFFDDHPRFLETSRTGTHLSRLNWRHRAMIEDNTDLLDGARVLDIASHDGRWSCAALEAGAKHVTGIEGRPELVENAQENLKHYGFREDRYHFLAGDLFETLAGDHGIQADVALCLGFLYHTIRYPETFLGVRSVGAEYLVLDTHVSKSDEQVIRILADDVAEENNATDNSQAYQGRVLAGWPSEKALEFMLQTYGFEVVKRFDWRRGLTPGATGVRGYRTGIRITWVARAV